jgi:hypothetical protein
MVKSIDQQFLMKYNQRIIIEFLWDEKPMLAKSDKDFRHIGCPETCEHLEI